MHLGLIGYGGIAKGLLGAAPPALITQATVLLRASADVASFERDVSGHTDTPVRFVTDVDTLSAARPDLVVECAGHNAVADQVAILLGLGRDVIIASVGALADGALHSRIIHEATRGRSRFILPSGAIGGLDLLRAAAQDGTPQVHYQGVKPARAWAGTPAEDVLDLAALAKATTFFSGTARAAALAYPKNANVVAALALAGGGFDTMRVELIADPEATGNRHSYTVVSPVCAYSMTIEATPSQGNAKTSQTTVLSILHEIAEYQVSRSVNRDT